MAKLYATLETSRGKIVDVSDNQEIVATVYDGNKKAYSVIIEWANIGDLDVWKCPDCGHFEEWNNYNDGTPICPSCDIDMKLQPAVMGAIVTTREWRNQPYKKRRRGPAIVPDTCAACGETGGRHSDDACEPYKGDRECYRKGCTAPPEIGDYCDTHARQARREAM